MSMGRCSEVKRPLWRVIVVFIIVLLAFGQYAITRLILAGRVQDGLDEVRESGQPVSLRALNDWYSEPPHGHNAAEVLEDAFRCFTMELTTSELFKPWSNWSSVVLDSDALSSEQCKGIEVLLASNSRALELLHQGAAIERCRYPVDLRGADGWAYPHLLQMGHGGDLLGLEALLAVEQADDERAVQGVISLLGLARSLKNEPIEVSQLRRMSLNRKACRLLEWVLSRLSLNDRQLLRLEKMLVASETEQSATPALIGDRCRSIDFFLSPCAAAAKFWMSASEMTARSLLGRKDADFCSYLDTMAHYVQASALPFSERRAVLTSVDSGALQKTLVSIRISTFQGLLRHDALESAWLRSAIMALAVERYCLATGRLPLNAGELVPAYLSRIPVNPLGDGALRYTRSGNRYAVYSVSCDGTNQSWPLRFTRKCAWNENIPDGAVVFLVRKPNSSWRSVAAAYSPM